MFFPLTLYSIAAAAGQKTCILDFLDKSAQPILWFLSHKLFDLIRTSRTTHPRITSIHILHNKERSRTMCNKNQMKVLQFI
jgi:hypothetical protein